MMEGSKEVSLRSASGGPLGVSLHNLCFFMQRLEIISFRVSIVHLEVGKCLC